MCDKIFEQCKFLSHIFKFVFFNGVESEQTKCQIYSLPNIIVSKKYYRAQRIQNSAIKGKN